MKKVFALVLTLCLLLGLAACKTQESSDHQQNTAPQQSTTPQDTTTPKEDPSDPTQGMEPLPTENPYAALSGKYMIYHIVTSTTELDYFQISVSRYAQTYIMLHDDGTISGMLFGSEMPEGNTWDVEAMTITNEEGETVPLVIEDNALHFTLNNGTMTLLKEGDSRLDALPTPYQYLYDYVVANGTQDDSGYTVICKETDTYQTCITATTAGELLCKHIKGNHISEMALAENTSTLTITMLYKEGLMGYDFTCIGTFDPTTVTTSKIVFLTYTEDPDPSKWGMSDMYKTIMELYAQNMLLNVQSYLRSNVGITVAAFGFDAYNY